MLQILRYFIAAPLIGLELLVASFFINLLALTVPLFVTLVLQRYVTFGVDSTLITLTTGALVGISFEFLLRNARLRLAIQLSQKSITNLAIGAYGLLATINYPDYSNLPKQERHGLFQNIDKIATAHSGQNICTLLDIPFAILFVGVIYAFSPALALVIFSFIALITLISWVSQLWAQKRVRDYEKTASQAHETVSRIALAGETTRVFDPELKLVNHWKTFFPETSYRRNKLGLLQGQIQNQAGLLQALLSIIVIAYGAILVIDGTLPVSVLIGVNILASRALNPFVRLSQISITLAQGKQSQKQIRSLAKLKTENNKTNILPHFQGGLSFKTVSFGHKDQPVPLFKDIDLSLSGGKILTVTGDNGVGKTSFCRLILGLTAPTGGQILADGTDIAQLPPRWWRQQICYFPQNPGFIASTVRENIALVAPALRDEEIMTFLAKAGLTDFIAKSSEGLDMAVSVTGDNLSYGIARRLAFARALANGGKIALFDEPTEGLDQKGRAALYQQLDLMKRAKMSIIICSNEEKFIKWADYILDLNNPASLVRQQQATVPKATLTKTPPPKRQIRIIS